MTKSWTLKPLVGCDCLTGICMQAGSSLPLSFLESARHQLLLRDGRKSIPIACPVRIFHSLQDTVVPTSISRELTEKLATDDVHITLIKVCIYSLATALTCTLSLHTVAWFCCIQDGDHRLSRPQDLSAIMGAVSEMVDY